jgi:PAS domain S-box-containing protein
VGLPGVELAESAGPFRFLALAGTRWSVPAGVAFAAVVATPYLLIEDPLRYRPGGVLILPVLVAAVVCGLAGTLAASAVSLVVFWWLVALPSRSFRLDAVGDLIALGSFAVTVGLVVAIVASYERSRRRVDALIAVAQVEEAARRAASDAEAATNLRYRRLVQATTSMVLELDPELRCTSPQPEWERFTGQRWPDYEGHQYLERLHHDDVDAVLESVLDAAAAAERYEVLTRVRGQSGQWRWMRCQGAPVVEDDTPAGFIVTATDVHELELARREAAEVGARLSALVEADVLAVYSGVEDRITEANDAFLELIGADQALLDAGALRWTELTPDGFEEVDGQALHQLGILGRADPFEKRYRRLDGGTVPVQVGVARLSSDPIRWIAYAADLTERQRVEARLADLYAERDEVARVLQASLLPPELPQVEGLELAARYLPSPAGGGIGGDFYDVFGGRDGAWHVVVGDVCGKGPSAAAATAVARHSMRVAALEHGDPVEIVELADQALRQAVGDGRFVTAALVSVVAQRATVVLAGHHHCRLVRGTAVERVGEPGSLLGVLDETVWRPVGVDLVPGDQLVLFTDGLIEQRPSTFGHDEVDALLAELAGRGTSVEQVAAALAATASATPGRSDDVAVLVAGFVGS